MSESTLPRLARIKSMPRWVRGLDFIVFAMLALTAWAIVAGGARVTLGPLHLAATSSLRLAVESFAIVLFRYACYRRVGLVTHALGFKDELGQWLAPVRAHLARWPGSLLPVTSAAAATRIAVLLCGVVAVYAVGYSADAMPAWRVSGDEVANLPARWDSGWYLGIASHGYQWDPAIHGQQNLAFFPAYPLAMKVAVRILRWHAPTQSDVLWAGVVVSVIAFTIAIGYLYLLARDRIGDEAAVLATMLLAVYPFAVFFSAAYTESFYLLCAVATFYHFSRGALGRAAIWGIVAGLTRPNGWTIALSLALIAWPVFGIAKRWTWPDSRAQAPEAGRHSRLAWILATAAPLAGLAIYCAYIAWLTGSPLTWAHLMTYWNRDARGAALIATDLHVLSAVGVFGYVARRPVDAMNALAFLFGLSSIVPVTRRLGPAYGLFVLLNVAMPALSGGLVSIGRYSSVLFPSFMWAGVVTPRPLRPALIAALAIGEGLGAALFFSWRAFY